MGTLRSLGALARALGPIVAASGKAVGQYVMCPGEPGLGGCWTLMGASLHYPRLLLPPFWPLGAGAVGPRPRLAVSPSSVLADRGPGLLHRVLGALPAPLPPPAAPATSSAHTQGGVAEPAQPRTEELSQEVRGTRLLA